MARQCRECKSKNIQPIDVDDATITVRCNDCGEVYLIEPDGFDEGGMEWAEAMELKELGLLG